MNGNNDKDDRKAKRRRITLAVAAAASAAVLMGIGGATAYFTDVDYRENIISIGRTSVELNEETFEDSRTLVPGSVVPKDPVLRNTGNRNEYVFMKVEVPKANVTLLYEADDGEHSAGTSKGEKKLQQIFSILTDDNGTSIVDVNGRDIQFDYHAKNESNEKGWYLIDSKVSDERDTYVFAYSKRLDKGDKGNGESTVPLFDKVQLRSFIDGELAGGTEETINIVGMSIQTRNLGVEGLEDEAVSPTAEQLREIYGIVERKAART